MPTRLNVADDPTCDRPPIGLPVLDSLLVPGLGRLFLLLQELLPQRDGFPIGSVLCCSLLTLSRSFLMTVLVFVDPVAPSTAPWAILVKALAASLSLLDCSLASAGVLRLPACPFLSSCLVSSVWVCLRCVFAMAPSLDLATKLTDFELQAGMFWDRYLLTAMLPITKTNREAFLASFFQWCREQELDVDSVSSDSWRNIEEINRILVAYGRALYSAGRPHSHYIECINAVTSYRPVLRRSLQEAWDLGFSWVRQEPSTHHVAAPFQVCLAMLTTCLLWGWTRTAGAIAFCFGGLLRPGEMISAVRRQLLLPSDVAQSTSYMPFCLSSSPRHVSELLDINTQRSTFQTSFEFLKLHSQKSAALASCGLFLAKL